MYWDTSARFAMAYVNYAGQKNNFKINWALAIDYGVLEQSKCTSTITLVASSTSSLQLMTFSSSEQPRWWLADKIPSTYTLMKNSSCIVTSHLSPIRYSSFGMLRTIINKWKRLSYYYRALDTAHQALFIQSTYVYLVTEFGNQAYLTNVQPWVSTQR